PRSRRPGFPRTGRAWWSESCVLLLSLNNEIISDVLKTVPRRQHGGGWVIGRTWPLEPLRGRGHPCSPSWEECAHGQEQARQRKDDEHDLVDVLCAGRQSAHEVHGPEDRVIPESEPRPPLPASVRTRGDQEAEQPHPAQRHADRSQVWRATRRGCNRDDEAKGEDGDADASQPNPTAL